MGKTELIASPGKQDILIRRTLEAPRDLVFKTILDPKFIPEWWGPRDLTTRVEKFEPWPGGQWRFIQQDAEGRTYPFHGVYHAVRSPELIINTFEWEGLPDHVLLVIAHYEDKDGITISTERSIFETVEDRDGMLQTGMEMGATTITERLNELFAKLELYKGKENTMDLIKSDGECITITRTFNARPEQVWAKWTDPDQYMCWWGPKDFTAPVAKIDLRPGGKFLSCMRDSNGKDYWDTGTYETIEQNKRLVYTDSFADEHGNIVPASYYGMGSDEPFEMAVEVTLNNLGEKTMMTVQQCGMPGADMREQAKIGWNQSLDKLDACLR